MQWEYKCMEKFFLKYILLFIGIQNQCILVSLAGLNLLPHFLIQNMPVFVHFFFSLISAFAFDISSQILSLKFLILINSLLED